MGVCSVCGKRIDPELVRRGRNVSVCSKRCMYLRVKIKPLKTIMLVFAIFSVVLILVGVMGFSLDQTNAFIWLVILVVPGVLLIIFGIPILVVEYKRASKYQREEVHRKFFCPFCEAEIEKPEDEGPIICMSCGKKTPMCQICGKRIMEEEEVYSIEPCGHTVHKYEIWDWLEKSKKCPSSNCEVTITKIDVDLKND